MTAPATTARCACGRVELAATGRPISSLVCYCDDCQRGAEQLEARPGTPRVRDADGGVAYVLYRKDRVRYAAGADLVHHHKLRAGAPTSRVVATCCNAPLMLAFDDSRHWVAIFHARLPEAPPLEMRINTRFAPSRTTLPRDVPASARLPLRFIGKLVAAQLAMLVMPGRR